MLTRAARLFAPWRAASGHILGVHVRGTDKVVARKVPAEAYFPLVDAWIAAFPDALVLVATDERSYHSRFVARYGQWVGDRGKSAPPMASVEATTATTAANVAVAVEEAVPPPRRLRRLTRRRPRGGSSDATSSLPTSSPPPIAGRTGGRIISAGSGYVTANVIADGTIRAHTKGHDVLIDALLLSKVRHLAASHPSITFSDLPRVMPSYFSKCDFLIKTASAVAEFAIWVNLRLHANHLDLQYEDRFRSQTLPGWAATVGRNDAQPYCKALLHACRIDGGGGDDTGDGSLALLRSGQSCARCQPRVDAGSDAAARRAVPLSPEAMRGGSGRCEDAPVGGVGVARRGLTHAECVAYARSRRLEFLGVQREPSEFAGCVAWNGRTVEFNADKKGSGCNVAGKGGECLCTSL